MTSPSPAEDPQPDAAAPEPPAPPRGEAWKALVALALFAIAGWLVVASWEKVRVDWHLGDLRRDPGDEAARAALARLGERALPFLARELESPDENARLVATLALAGIEGEGAAALLEKAARDPDALTAANAIYALAQRAEGEGSLEARAAQAVRAGLDDARFTVRMAARRALARRTGVAWWAWGRRDRDGGS